MKPSLLITGGFGNLGSWLTRHFCGLGWNVTVLARREQKIPVKGFRFIQCDITSLEDCRIKLQGQSFDYVLHTASTNDTFVEGYAELALQVNAKGTRNLLDVFAKQPPRHFVYFSTFHVYGAASGEVTETSPLAPRHDYATTHLFAEYYVQQFSLTHRLPYTIIRLTNSYGCPLTHESTKWYLVLNDLSRMAIEEKKIVLRSNGKASRDFIWMGTVCSVMEQLLNLPKAPNGIYNLSGEVTFSMRQIAEKVSDAYERFSGEQLPLQVNFEDQSPATPKLFVSSRKLKELIGDFQSTEKFEEEATRIFHLLQDAAKQVKTEEAKARG